MAKNILIVDDSESIREVVGMALRSEGYNVIVGEDGQHGYELLLANENNFVHFGRLWHWR